MKNLGITGGLALVAAGLLANAFVTLDDDLQASVNPLAPIVSSVPDDPIECVELDPQNWFAQDGELLCNETLYAARLSSFFALKNGFDMDGDSIADHIPTGEMIYYPESGIDSYLLEQVSYSVARGSGDAWFITKRNLIFDYYQLIPNPKVRTYVSTILFDVDGDKKLDLIVQCRTNVGSSDPEPSIITWHRNITPGNPLAADINLDGIVNGIDLAIVLASWNTPG